MKSILFILLLSIPLALAIDCSTFQDPETCLEIINNPELSEEEIQMIISALIYQSYYPDHDFL